MPGRRELVDFQESLRVFFINRLDESRNIKRMMIKLIQKLEPKPRQVSVVDLTVCVGERRVHECLNMALVNTTVDRAGSACSVEGSIKLKHLSDKTNTTFMPLQRHRVTLSSPCSHCLCLLPCPPLSFLFLLFIIFSHLMSFPLFHLSVCTP